MAAAEAIVPILLLAALILIHPVSIDLAVERFFAPDGVFPLRNAPLLVLFHKWAKLVTALVGIAVIAAALTDRKKPSPRVTVTEAAYFITAMLLCVGVVSLLKHMTGVYCPRFPPHSLAGRTRFSRRASDSVSQSPGTAGREASPAPASA